MGYIRQVNTLFLKLICWKQNKHKDLNDFDMGQIVMARRLGQSISKNCRSCGMFPVCNGQDEPKVVQGRKTMSGFIDACWEPV